MTALVTCAEQLDSLTTALASASPAQLAALESVLPVASGGIAAPVASGTPVATATFVTVASFVAPKAGVIAVHFATGLRSPAAPTVDGLMDAFALIFKGATRVASGSDAADFGPSKTPILVPQASHMYLAVAAGDVISGQVFIIGGVGAFPGAWSTETSDGAAVLTYHYL